MPDRRQRPPKNRSAYRGVTQTGAGVAVETPGGGMLQVTFQGYVRRKTVERPWAVINDFVGSTLALAMGVPTPANTLLVVENEEPGHLTVQYGLSGMRAANVFASTAAERDPWAATGIMVLDQWVHNDDRHDNMLQFGKHGIVAIDHDGCLSGMEPHRDVAEYLTSLAATPLTRHDIADALTTAEHVTPWVRRVLAVQPEEISRIGYQLLDNGMVTDSERQAIQQFLRYRQAAVGGWMQNVMATAGTPLGELSFDPEEH